MEEYNPEETKSSSEEQHVEEGEVSSPEEAFMKGYLDEDEVKECAECGSAVGENIVVKEFDGEEYVFCSKICVKEFEENMG